MDVQTPAGWKIHMNANQAKSQGGKPVSKTWLEVVRGSYISKQLETQTKAIMTAQCPLKMACKASLHANDDMPVRLAVPVAVPGSNRVGAGSLTLLDDVLSHVDIVKHAFSAGIVAAPKVSCIDANRLAVLNPRMDTKGILENKNHPYVMACLAFMWILQPAGVWTSIFQKWCA